MPDSLKTLKSGFDLSEIIKTAKAQDAGEGVRPVDRWNPPYCGEMDMVIKADGSWWHEGTRITRTPLIQLFASILRKDEDGRTYLVTPVEKIGIQVERAHFIAIRVDKEGEGVNQKLYFTTDMGDVVEAGTEHSIRIETDPATLEPDPYVNIRGRLEAAMTRPVFYELVDYAQEVQTDAGPQLGVYSGGTFFPLGPVGAHDI